jgi:hypothetical protein
MADEEVDIPIEETPEEDDFVAVGGATEVKLFGKWSFDDIEVRDISLVVRREEEKGTEKMTLHSITVSISSF